MSTRLGKLASEVTILSQKVSYRNKIIENQNELIAKLVKKIETMEGKFLQLRSELLVTKNVSKLLSVKMVDNTQYSKRNCLIFDGLDTDHRDSEESIKKKVKNSSGNELSSTISALENIDRTHRLPSIRNGKNSVIIKFKSFTDRSEVYKKEEIFQSRNY